MTFIDSFDLAMLAVIAACLFWLRSLRIQNAELRARVAADSIDPSKRTFVVIVESDVKTGLLVGFVPGIDDAHSQAQTWSELRGQMQEVLELLDRAGQLKSGHGHVVGQFVVTLGREGAQ